jgi:hypothetical protein
MSCRGNNLTKRKRKNGEHGDRKIHNRTNKGKVESKNVFLKYQMADNMNM